MTMHIIIDRAPGDNPAADRWTLIVTRAEEESLHTILDGFERLDTPAARSLHAQLVGAIQRAVTDSLSAHPAATAIYAGTESAARHAAQVTTDERSSTQGEAGRELLSQRDEALRAAKQLQAALDCRDKTVEHLIKGRDETVKDLTRARDDANHRLTVCERSLTASRAAVDRLHERRLHERLRKLRHPDG
jgi:hypothetical protein